MAAAAAGDLAKKLTLGLITDYFAKVKSLDESKRRFDGTYLHLPMQLDDARDKIIAGVESAILLYALMH